MSKFSNAIRKYDLFICFIFLLLFQSCAVGENNHSNAENTANEISIPKVKSIKKAINYSLYIDNSIGMKGFYQANNSVFLQNLNQLIVQIADLAEHNGGRFNVYTYSDSINLYETLVSNNINKFLDKINVYGFSPSISTDFYDLMVQMIDSVNDDNFVVVISDGLPEPVRADESIDKYLDLKKNKIYASAFEKLEKNPFDAFLLSCKSMFDGDFFDQHHNTFHCTNVELPFLIYGMGGHGVVSDFLNHAVNNNQQLKYEHIAISFDPKKINIGQKIVLSDDYQIVGDASDMIIKKTKSTNGLQASLLLNFSDLPLVKERLLNSAYYTLLANGIEIKNATISVAEVANKMDPATSGFTHKVKISIPKTNGQKEFVLRYKFHREEWVSQLSTNEAIDPIHPDFGKKIFGFENIISGLEKAYMDHGYLESYFDIKIVVQY